MEQEKAIDALGRYRVGAIRLLPAGASIWCYWCSWLLRLIVSRGHGWVGRSNSDGVAACIYAGLVDVCSFLFLVRVVFLSACVI